MKNAARMEDDIKVVNECKSETLFQLIGQLSNHKNISQYFEQWRTPANYICTFIVFSSKH